MHTVWRTSLPTLVSTTSKASLRGPLGDLTSVTLTLSSARHSPLMCRLLHSVWPFFWTQI